jgi:hypothetical protein
VFFNLQNFAHLNLINHNLCCRVYEIKFDGYRALALRGGSETRMLSRNEKDLGSKFPEVKDSIAALDVQDAIIDYAGCGIMQSIFRSATRREALGSHSEGGRRGGELKIDWTKPLPRAWPMCIDCRLDLWRGSEGAASGQQGIVGMVRGGSNGLSLRRRTTFVPWIRFAMGRVAAMLLSLGPAKLAPQFDLPPKTVLFIMRYRQSPVCYVRFVARFRWPACDLGGRLGTLRTTGRLVLDNAHDNPFLRRLVVLAPACPIIFGIVAF